MRAPLRLLLLLAPALAALACSSPASPPLGPWPDGGVPNPGEGHQVDIAFDNLFPNDTPDLATPLGTSIESDVTVWIGDNVIGGMGNEANYFVFRTGPSSGTFAFDGCFTSPITAMTATFSTVVEANVILPPVATWTTQAGDASGGCLNNASAPMDANTVYLFGLTAVGGPGTYSL
jgi:hypothetical protein